MFAQRDIIMIFPELWPLCSRLLVSNITEFEESCMTFDELCITQPWNNIFRKDRFKSEIFTTRNTEEFSQPIRGIRGIKKTNGVEKFSDGEVGKKSSEIKQKIHARFKLWKYNICYDVLFFFLYYIVQELLVNTTSNHMAATRCI